MVPLRQPRPRALRERIGGIAELLLDRGAKLLVIACNTATSVGQDVARAVAGERGVEVVPVVEPQAEIAAAITDNARVGSWRRRTRSRAAPTDGRWKPGPRLDVIEVQAPDLAPFIQNGSLFDEETMAMARGYCAPLKKAEVDTLILGCTHYPLVAPMLQRILGRDVRLVSGGHAVAAAVQRTLEGAGLARPTGGEGAYDFLCTGDTDSFRELAPASCRCRLARSSGSISPDSLFRAPNFTELAPSARHACALIRQRSRHMPVLTVGNTVYTHPVAKVMISIPDEILDRIDAHLRETRETRSGFLRRLAEREIDAEKHQPSP